MRIFRIDLREPEKKHGRTIMSYCGADIGASYSPIYAAARWLLDNNHAKSDDTVATYRGDMPCMSGKAGELAKWTIAENDRGDPTFSLRRWKGFSAENVAPPAARTPRTPPSCLRWHNGRPEACRRRLHRDAPARGCGMTAPSRITLSAALKAAKSAGTDIGRIEVAGDAFTLYSSAEAAGQSAFDVWEAKRNASRSARRAPGQAEAR